MATDIALIISDAFDVFRQEYHDFGDIHDQMTSSKERAEEIAKLVLKHLYELNIVSINAEGYRRKLAKRADQFANYATVTLPANRAEMLAVSLDEADPFTLEKMLNYLSPEKKAQLWEMLNNSRR